MEILEMKNTISRKNISLDGIISRRLISLKIDQQIWSKLKYTEGEKNQIPSMCTGRKGKNEGRIMTKIFQI